VWQFLIKQSRVEFDPATGTRVAIYNNNNGAGCEQVEHCFLKMNVTTSKNKGNKEGGYYV